MHLHFRKFEWYILNYHKLFYGWTVEDFAAFWDEPHLNRRTLDGTLKNHFYQKWLECDQKGILFFLRMDDKNRERIFEKLKNISYGLMLIQNKQLIDVFFSNEELLCTLKLLDYDTTMTYKNEETFMAFWGVLGFNPRKGCTEPKRLWESYKAEDADAIKFFVWMNENERRHYYKILCAKYDSTNGTIL